MRAVLDVDYSAHMRALDMPVLYLQAVHDRIVPGSAFKHLAALCPQIQMVSLDAPHLLLQTRPTEAAAIVGRFATSVSSPDPRLNTGNAR